IWADPVRIRQVFWNVIRNAAKFTPARGHITISSSNDPNGHFQLEVSDTGIGIEHSQQSAIFDAFRQESRFVTPEFVGLGLGLTISKRLVDLHHGTIEVESAGKNHGSTFRIVIAAVQEQKIIAHKTSGNGAASKSLRLLLVEDHADTRRTIS